MLLITFSCFCSSSRRSACNVDTHRWHDFQAQIPYNVPAVYKYLQDMFQIAIPQGKIKVYQGKITVIR